jgi:hypothetical protein
MGLPAPYIGHTFLFPDLPKALDTFLGGHTTGKVVVLTEDQPAFY